MHRNRPLVVGVTGGIAAGKSTVCRMLFDGGGCVGRRSVLQSRCTERTAACATVVSHFGEEVALRNGQGATMDIDRSALAKKVFGHPDELAWLESKVHPAGGPRVRHLARRSSGTLLGGARGSHLVRVWQRPRLRRGGDGGGACGVASSACPGSRRLVRRRGTTHERPMAFRRPNCPRPSDHLERRCATFAASSGTTVRHRPALWAAWRRQLD